MPRGRARARQRQSLLSPAQIDPRKHAHGENTQVQAWIKGSKPRPVSHVRSDFHADPELNERRAVRRIERIEPPHASRLVVRTPRRAETRTQSSPPGRLTSLPGPHRSEFSRASVLACARGRWAPVSTTGFGNGPEAGQARSPYTPSCRSRGQSPPHRCAGPRERRGLPAQSPPSSPAAWLRNPW